MNKNVYIGIGFHRDVEAAEIEGAICRFLEELGIGLREVKGLCTSDFRKTEQLEEFSSKFRIPLFFFSRDEINSVEGVQSRSAASDVLNIKGVAEPCAILATKKDGGKFKFMKRRSYDRKITLAVVL